MTGKERPADGREVDTDANGVLSSRQVSRDQELVVPEPAVGCLDDVLSRAQLLAGIGVDAGV